MSGAHARYAEWDAAYAIGALSMAERREFEAHLEQCPLCRRAVAELAPAVAVLPRLSVQDVAALEAGDVENDATSDAAARADIVSLARERRRRRRAARWIAVAAAVLVVVGVAVPLGISAMSAPAVAFTLEDVANVPLSATARLTSVDWGTRIDVDCRYPDDSAHGVPDGGWEYALAVVDEKGQATTVSTWRAGPGSRARFSAATATALSAISAIEIRAADGGVLMRYRLAHDGG